jgi:hypothetical protein
MSEIFFSYEGGTLRLPVLYERITSAKNSSFAGVRLTVPKFSGNFFFAEKKHPLASQNLFLLRFPTYFSPPTHVVITNKGVELL